MKLLSIGQFAQLVGLSVSALRFYAESGVLTPAQVDQDSGYRYYAPEQVPAGQRVAALRRLELPLGDLAALLGAAPEEAARLLERHERRLLERFQAQRALLLEVGELLRGQRTLDPVDVTYRHWPAQHALSVTRHAEAEAFHSMYVQSLDELRGYAHRSGVAVTGTDFGLYHAQEYFAGPLQVEICLPVAAPVAGSGGVRSLTLPAAPVACALHQGDWRTFSATYAALHLTASAAGHTPGSSYTLSTLSGTELGFFLN